MASLDELEMVLLMRLSEIGQPLHYAKIVKLLPIPVTDEHLNVMLRHLRQCEFVDLSDTHGELFAEATFVGNTVAKTCMAQLSKMERGLISRAEANNHGPEQMLHPSIQISNTFTPSNTFSPAPNGSSENSTARAAWLGAWGTWAAVGVAVAAIFVTLKLAGTI